MGVYQVGFEITLSANLRGSWTSSAPISAWIVPPSYASSISTTGTASHAVWSSSPNAMSGTISGQVTVGRDQSIQLAVVFGNPGMTPVTVTVTSAIGWASS